MVVARYQKMNLNKCLEVLIQNNILETSDLDDNMFKALIADADRDGDGEIDYNEFIDMMDKMKS